MSWNQWLAKWKPEVAGGSESAESWRRKRKAGRASKKRKLTNESENISGESGEKTKISANRQKAMKWLAAAAKYEKAWNWQLMTETDNEKLSGINLKQTKLESLKP